MWKPNPPAGSRPGGWTPVAPAHPAAATPAPPSAERVDKTVFISYRRRNFPWAQAVYQDLKQKGYDVFVDFDGLASGDFEGKILQNIVSRAHFLLLLTPIALDRCHEPGDLLRREIETAIDSKRNIIPLLLDDFTFSDPRVAAELNGPLAMLRSYNGLLVPTDYFNAAMERLHTKYLSVPLSTVLHPKYTAVAESDQQK